MFNYFHVIAAVTGCFLQNFHILYLLASLEWKHFYANVWAVVYFSLLCHYYYSYSYYNRFMSLCLGLPG